MHFCKIYLHISFFFHSAFSQTSSKPRYMSRNLMRKYALTSIAYKFLDIGIIVGSISHVQIAIDNRGYRMVNRSSCYVENIHQEACKYRAINAVNSPIIIIDSRSKCATF